MIETVTGAVLAGGRSSRFGSNKAVAAWGEGTLTGTAVSCLSGIFPSVLVVGKDASVVEGLKSSVRFVSDESKISHPLVGILAALREAETDRVFVTACDMPLLSPFLIRTLCEAASGYPAVTAVWNDKPQPLCAIYSQECAGVIQLLLKENRPVRHLFDIVRTRFLTSEEIGAADPSGCSFMDIDTPADYNLVLKRAHA